MDIKEIRKLVKELRKLGVTEYKAEGVELKLAPESPKTPKAFRAPKIPAGHQDVSDSVNIETDYPTQDELLFMAVGGPPKEY
jgi:hypothetical protein